MSKTYLNYHYNEYDAIKGKRIIMEAQRISKPSEISGRTSRHGGQRIKADNAEAWIESAYIKGGKIF